MIAVARNLSWCASVLFWCFGLRSLSIEYYMSYVILYFLERNGFGICWDVCVGLGRGGPFSDSY